MEYWKCAEKKWLTLAAITRDYLTIPAASVGVERLFNMSRDICSYRRYNLKPDIIRALIIFIYIDYYLLYENLQIIKVSNNIEEEALSKKINNNKLREIKIYRFINNNEEDIDFKEERNNLILFIKFPLLPR